ncbi:gas vesicle protein GvpO, halophile-type [Halalkalicoccus jeotgali]|uniref:Gas vesicle synthesis family protein n=1 Tax=Halalkalicoccus jeotgali (strain DSM 18796 / CECT 7217 / JCM 14584 / KCTC 4019 / B3) TaxID=795797 RepID=D8J5N8_HALJB|nr:gas vesicle protein GvpO [Halalkalicoccus jeotgali]ADJ15734.1 Gas vesicle synthesis family protein [Halalkalicoccus jeotgali B3]ELY37242.1 Gas vesicle synthesis family protein [Halalkalicoccus jeotgali B3]
MSDAETADEQCQALTSGGERCTRPAQGDGFCYQHGPDDETIDDHQSEDSDMADNDSVSETEIGTVREKIRQVAADLIGRPLVSVVSVDRDRSRGEDNNEEGWVAAVEILERKSVPDTQDILGRYEITLDADHEITGYRRTHRYRRDDMDQDV